MPTVLEQFYFEFVTNSDKAKREFDGVERSADSVGKKLEDLDVKSTGSADGFEVMARRAGAAALALISVAGASKAINFNNQIDSIGKSAELWGANVTELNKYQQLAIRFGGTAEGMTSTLDSLNSGLQEIALTGSGSLLPIFNLLGISALDASGKARSAFEVFPEIIRKMQALTTGEQVSIGRMLGFDDATIRLIQAGTEEINKLSKAQDRLGLITPEEAKSAAAFADSMANLSQVLGTISRMSLTSISSELTKFVDGLTELGVFVKDNFDDIKKLFGFLADPSGTAIRTITEEIIERTDDQGRVHIGPTKQEILDRIDDKGRLNIGPTKEEFGEIIDGIRDFIFRADASPLNSMTSQSISNINSSQNGGTVNIDRIEVSTQATDADGIASAINESLSNQMKATVNTFDDGVLA